MNKHADRYQVPFHDRAQRVMHRLYDDFTAAAGRLDRQGDEHVFRQLQGKYCSQLQRELKAIALELLTTIRPDESGPEAYPAFHVYIEAYVHEFTLKIRSL